MTYHEDTTTSGDLLQTLQDIDTRWHETENLLEQLMQQLAQRGLQLSVNMAQLARDARQHLGTAQKEAKRTLEQLERLQDLIQQSAVITSSLELNQVLERVMDTVIGLTNAERAFLMLYEDGSNALSIRSARNWDQETLKDQDRAYSSSVVEAAVDEGQPIITTNAQDDARFESAKSIAGMNLLSILCIPLSLQGKTVGVLYADSRFQVGIFRQEMIPLLAAFATQAAIAIQNASQFEQVKSDLEEAQKQVQELRIQIDRERMDQQLSAITDSEYFQRLKQDAAKLRKDFRGDE